MLDFVRISTRSKKQGVVEIYPNFVMKKSSDLMIRGGFLCRLGRRKWSMVNR